MSKSPNRFPRTLATPVVVKGHGLHSNVPCTVRLVPTESATGIRFLHTPTRTEIPALADWVGDLSLATTLVKDGIKLGTVEHLLSALAGLGIEHALIEVDGVELPILDGSSEPWIREIQKVGIREIPGRRRYIRMLRPVEVRQGEKWIRISPHSEYRIRYSIDFPHPSIGYQAREITLTAEKYTRELSNSRTFCLERDIETMRSLGLAKGGSLDNAVVYGEAGPLNDALRHEDEAVRHKMLDLVGDLSLLGAPIKGLVEAHAAGHAMHVALVRAIQADPTAWTWDEAEPSGRARSPFFNQGLHPHPIPA